MKIGLISDIHGDVAALRLALDRLDALGAGRVLCAGDLVGYGPSPDAVVDLLRERNVGAVRGNHDRWALERGPGEPDPFGGPAPSEASLAFLRDLPPVAIRPAAGRLIVVVHGVPGDDLTYLTPPQFAPAHLHALLDDLGADVLVAGHTHQPAWYRGDLGLVVNPGSVVARAIGGRSSRTCAWLDTDDLVPRFLDLDTGAAVHVAPWPDDAGASPAV